MAEPLLLKTVESPLGPLTAVLDAEGRLRRLAFAGEKVPAAEREAASGANGAALAAAEAGLARLRAQLAEYFAGSRRDFEVPMAPRGTTFQRRVWEELCRIPYGATLSYRELAARVGRPAAIRAVGRANATNPLPILVPCHRVIGTDGSLTGYGGGLDKKQRLLELEGARVTTARE